MEIFRGVTIVFCIITMSVCGLAANLTWRMIDQVNKHLPPEKRLQAIWILDKQCTALSRRTAVCIRADRCCGVCVFKWPEASEPSPWRRSPLICGAESGWPSAVVLYGGGTLDRTDERAIECERRHC